MKSGGGVGRGASSGVGAGGGGAGVGLIKTYRVGSVAVKSHKYMFIIANDIKRIKYH